MLNDFDQKVKINWDNYLGFRLITRKKERAKKEKKHSYNKTFTIFLKKRIKFHLLGPRKSDRQKYFGKVDLEVQTSKVSSPPGSEIQSL